MNEGYYVEMGDERMYDLDAEFTDDFDDFGDFGSPYIDSLDDVMNTDVVFSEGGVFDDR